MNQRHTEHSFSATNRIGFHFFSEDNNFNDANLSAVLGQLPALQAAWIVLTATPQRAIPEFFIRSLVDHNISPIIHFDSSLSNSINPTEYEALLIAYANWGVTHVIFFDKPNDMQSWSTSDWVQQNIVDRFLDRFIPLANLAIEHGINPVLPPLMPGGSIWDTIFLRMVLEGLQRRNQHELLDHLIISAYGWTFGHCLNWGAGGSERNPEAKAYTPAQADVENHLGFRVIDWYNGICESILQRKLPAILLQAGLKNEPKNTQKLSEEDAKSILLIARILDGESIPDEDQPLTSLDPIPENVISCNFYCFDTNNPSLFSIEPEIKNSLHALLASKVSPKSIGGEVEQVEDHPLNEFVLIPSYEWGVADWHLDVIRPFIKKRRPIVGFSINEAKFAKNILAIGDQTQFSEDQLDELRQSGCRVERIMGSGTSIATILAER
jgi:hypothetical protein